MAYLCFSYATPTLENLRHFFNQSEVKLHYVKPVVTHSHWSADLLGYRLVDPQLL